ncbi:unnamed protein product [Agarophyton chilense]
MGFVADAPVACNAPIEPPLKKMRVSELLGISTDCTAPADHEKTLLTSSGTWAAAEAITDAMPKGDGIPLTLLTGFLGAGKSTVLNYILKADHGLKIAVLINEFGQVDIDNQLVDSVAKGEEGDPIMLNNGCMCCTVSNGFMDAVYAILSRADAAGRLPDYFIVETTGLANPQPIMDTIEATALCEDLYLDQVLTVVDSSAWDEQHYGSETAHKQIQAADTILLSKTDLTGHDNVTKVVKSILSIRPNARILRSQKGYVPIATLFDLGISMGDKPKTKKGTYSVKNAKVNKENGVITPGQTRARERDDDGDAKSKQEHEHGHDHDHDHKKEHEHGHEYEHKQEHEHVHEHEHKLKQEHEHGHNHDHKHDADGKCCAPKVSKEPKSHLEQEGFSSISFVSEYPFSLRRFKDEFVEKLPRGVFRAKGLIWFSNFDKRFVFHYSGSRYQVDEQEWPEGVERKNQLVVIGRELDKESITKMLEVCIVKPGDESEEEFEEEEEEEYGDANYAQVEEGEVVRSEVEGGKVDSVEEKKC